MFNGKIILALNVLMGLFILVNGQLEVSSSITLGQKDTVLEIVFFNQGNTSKIIYLQDWRLLMAIDRSSMVDFVDCGLMTNIVSIYNDSGHNISFLGCRSWKSYLGKYCFKEIKPNESFSFICPIIRCQKIESTSTDVKIGYGYDFIETSEFKMKYPDLYDERYLLKENQMIVRLPGNPIINTNFYLNYSEEVTDDYPPDLSKSFKRGSHSGKLLIK